MSKKLSLSEVMNRAIHAFEPKKVGRKNCFGSFLADGHVVDGTNIAWYQEGDGKKYGFSKDVYLAQSLSHHGFKVVKVR